MVCKKTIFKIKIETKSAIISKEKQIKDKHKKKKLQILTTLKL